MIPVTQTKVVVRNSKNEIIVNGNCLAAVLASWLELPIELIPNVETLYFLNNDLWQEVINSFLGGKGLLIRSADEYKVFHTSDWNPKEGTRAALEDELRDTLYLATGKSSRGVNHIVIMKNGNLFWDPHPTREGIIDITCFEVIEKI